MWLWQITSLFTCLVKAEAMWNYADLLVIGLGVFDEVLASLQKQEPRGVSMGKLSHLEMGSLWNRNLGFRDKFILKLYYQLMFWYVFHKDVWKVSVDSISQFQSMAHLHVRCKTQQEVPGFRVLREATSVPAVCFVFDCSRFDPFWITNVVIFMSSHHLQGFQSQIKHYKWT